MARQLIDCAHCGGRHYPGTAAQLECQRLSSRTVSTGGGITSIQQEMSGTVDTLVSPRMKMVVDTISDMDLLIDKLDAGEITHDLTNDVIGHLGTRGATIEQREAAFRLHHELSGSSRDQDRETVAAGLDDSISRINGDIDRDPDLVYNVTASQVMVGDSVVVFDHEGNSRTHDVASVDKETDLNFRENSRIRTPDGEEFYLPGKSRVDVIHSSRTPQVDESAMNRSATDAADSMNQRIRPGSGAGYKPRHLYSALHNAHRDVPVSRVHNRDSVTSYRSDGSSLMMTPTTLNDQPAMSVEEYDAAGIPKDNQPQVMSMGESETHATMSRIIGWERGLPLR